MIATEFNGQAVYLLNVDPDWDSQVKLDVDLPADLTVGLSNREGRRGFAAALRVAKLAYAGVLQGVEARRFSGALRDYQEQPVLVPLWPAAVDLTGGNGEATGIDGGLLVAWKEGWGQWQILAGPMEDAEIPAWADWVAPALWGRLNKRELSWLNPDVAQVAVEFVEASPAEYALRPLDDGQGQFYGPTPSAAYKLGPRVFPFEVNFERPSTGYSLAIVRQALGFGRQPLEVVYPQTVARSQVGPYLVSSAAAIGRLLWFFEYHGAGSVFWAPTWTSELRLTAEIEPGDTVLQVEDTAAVKEGDWLGLLEHGGYYWTPRVVAVTENTVEVDAAAQEGFSTQALVSHLLLVRFDRPQLSLSFDGPEIVRCSIPLREVPPEYTPASDETIGATLGRLPTRCFLYELSRVLGGQIFTDCYTSFERDIRYDGNTYLARKLEHGEIKQGLTLEKDEVEIRVDVAVGGPLLELATLKLEAPLFVRILQGELLADEEIQRESMATPGAVEPWHAEVIFAGEVTRVGVHGSRLTARALAGGTLWDQRIPRMLVQLGCNHALFSEGCGLERGGWKFAAVVQNPGAVGYPFKFVLEALARVEGGELVYGANWFAGGWVEFGSPAVVVAGRPTWQRRAILQSSAVVDGVVTVTLDRDPEPFPAVGDAVVLYPGCDGVFETCRVKFGNKVNFGGHPFLPVANPSMVQARKGGASGGKK